MLSFTSTSGDSFLLLADFHGKTCPELVKYMHLKIECNEKIKLDNECQRNCTEMKVVARINQDGTVLVNF